MPMSHPLVSMRKVETRSARVASSTLTMAAQHSAPAVSSAGGKFWSERMKHAGELWPVPLSGMIWCVPLLQLEQLRLDGSKEVDMFNF